MATLAQRTEAVEERVDSLESILARFMARTDESIARLERIVEQLVQEGVRDREEAAQDREEAARERERERALAAQDREEAAREREREREIVAQDREEAARDRERDREIVAQDREEAARERERERALAAQDREEAARERERDREIVAQDREEAAREREREREIVAQDREEAARERALAAQDREEAARERERDRALAAQDREEAARERREMNKRWGELANKMGTVVEDIVAPSIRRLAREVFDCGDLVRFTTRQTVTRSDDRSRRREFDALYVGTRAVLLNSTKSSPRSEDARAFVEFLRNGEFARYFPEHRKLPIVPAFSSLSIPEDLVTYLTRHGIYAVAMGDEAMQVLNLKAVRSRTAAT